MSYATAPDSVFDQIRNNFVQKYKSNIEKEVYHPKDVERIKASSSWLRAFYKHSLEESDRTVEMIHDVLKWRKDFKCNDLLTPGKLPVPEELFKKGALFKRNEDNQCNPLLHFVVKTHKKDQFPAEQIYRFIAFFFEKNYKFNIEDPIVLLLDMADTGYSNLDMDLIKFIVNCLKTYYPGLIDYMIIFQMPFIFNAAWKIIKNWLPPQAIKLIKFVDKKTIKELVHESQLFVHMGGTDTYKYTYIRDEHVIKPAIEAFQSVSEFEQFKSVEPVRQDRIDEENSEKIDDTIKIVPSKKEMTETSSTKSKRSSKASLLAPKNTPKQNESSSNSVFNSSLISISPGDEIDFNECDGKNDIIQYIRLTNNSKSTLAYKIKITSPDKFRVKPGTGTIPSSGSVQVMVNFLKDYHLSTNNHRDKFLILWTEVGEKFEPSEMNDFWKQASLKKENIQDHKMKCIVRRANDLKLNENSSLLSEKCEIAAPIKATKILGDNVRLKTKFDDKTPEANGPISDLPQNETSYINLKLYNLDKNINQVILNQQNIINTQAFLIKLFYILLLLNMIFIILQSNYFSQYIEPFFDSILFKSNTK